VRYLTIVFLLIRSLSFGQNSVHTPESELLEIKNPLQKQLIIHPRIIYKDNWHTLPQTLFWKQIITLSPDSCLINVACNRKVLYKVSYHDWMKKTEPQKEFFIDSLKLVHALAAAEKINVTTGKNDFYKIKEVSPNITKGIQLFQKFGVDPWYAEAILLIESPAQLKKSESGAYGAFQLMPSVARNYGLIVNNSVDERENFERSAFGAAQLISRSCIPSVKSILQAHNIPYNETDLWFRLLVMHVYHAGATNVRAVINKIKPTQGGQELIKQIWSTTAGSFGNSSQNYSQVALATQLLLHEISTAH
jgi:hypothetical protein